MTVAIVEALAPQCSAMLFPVSAFTRGSATAANDASKSSLPCSASCIAATAV